MICFLQFLGFSSDLLFFNVSVSTPFRGLLEQIANFLPCNRISLRLYFCTSSKQGDRVCFSSRLFQTWVSSFELLAFKDKINRIKRNGEYLFIIFSYNHKKNYVKFGLLEIDLVFYIFQNFFHNFFSQQICPMHARFFKKE